MAAQLTDADYRWMAATILDVHQRQDRALRLRQAGVPFPQIAIDCGFRNAAVAEGQARAAERRAQVGDRQ